MIFILKKEYSEILEIFKWLVNANETNWRTVSFSLGEKEKIIDENLNLFPSRREESMLFLTAYESYDWYSMMMIQNIRDILGDSSTWFVSTNTRFIKIDVPDHLAVEFKLKWC